MAKGHHHLTYGSRCQNYALKKSGLSVRGVARALEVSASTVSRELRRNRGRRGYRMKPSRQAWLPSAQAIHALPAPVGPVMSRLRCFLIHCPVMSWAVRVLSSPRGWR